MPRKSMFCVWQNWTQVSVDESEHDLKVIVILIQGTNMRRKKLLFVATLAAVKCTEFTVKMELHQ